MRPPWPFPRCLVVAGLIFPGLFLPAACGRHAGAGAPGTAPLPIFTDAAADAGLRFTPDPARRPPLNILETAGYGGGFLDYNTDGWPDLLLVGKPRCRLYRNLRNGRFSDATREAGLEAEGHWMGCASADFDNDGDADLFLSGYGGAALFRNEGGRFHRVALEFPRDHWGTSAAFLDYDGDGRLDLYVGCYVRFGDGTPRLCDFGGVKAACSPSHYDAQAGHLYRNDADGVFREVTAEAGLARTHGKTLGVAVCDFNEDGRPDLYLANDGMPCDLFVNQGGRFVNQGLESGTAFNGHGNEQAGMGVDWGDCDGDGRPDLVVTTFQHEPISLYRNRGDGTFTESAHPLGLGDATVSVLGFGAKFLDADGDGRQDLLLANGHVQDAIGRMQPGVGYAQPVQLFAGRGDRFVPVDWQPAVAARIQIVGRGVSVADYDNDGRQDALVTNLEGEPLLLRNETPAGQGWLRLRLEGRVSPADGTGALVTVEAGGRKQTLLAGTAGGYLSCSDPRVHVGLGSAASVERLTVRWPSGRSQELRGLERNREHSIQEPAAGP